MKKYETRPKYLVILSQIFPAKELTYFVLIILYVQGLGWRSG
jgi:hypothetical protein